MNKRARLNYIHALSNNVERKKMYKAKKQWVVAGISFLVATGMGAIGSHFTTHAQVNNPTTNRVTSGANDTQKVPTSASSQQQSSASAKDIKPLSASNVQSQASGLHSQLLLQHDNKPINPQHHALTFDYAAPQLHNHLLNGQKQGTQKATNDNWIFNNGSYFSDGQINDWQPNQRFNGMYYKYSPSTKAIEFLSGKLQNNYSARSNIPQLNINSIKIDRDITVPSDLSFLFSGDESLYSVNMNGLDTNNVTRMRSMFWGDSSLISCKISDLNVSNVKDMSSLFQGTNVSDLDLSNWNTSNVSDIHSFADQDFNLRTVNFGGLFNTRKALNNAEGPEKTEFKYVLPDTSSLTKIILGPNAILSPYTTWNSKFSGGFDPAHFLNYNYISSDGKYQKINDGQAHQGVWTKDAEVINVNYDGKTVGSGVDFKPLSTGDTVSDVFINLPSKYSINNSDKSKSFSVSDGVTSINAHLAATDVIDSASSLAHSDLTKADDLSSADNKDSFASSQAASAQNDVSSISNAVNSISNDIKSINGDRATENSSGADNELISANNAYDEAYSANADIEKLMNEEINSDNNEISKLDNIPVYAYLTVPYTSNIGSELTSTRNDVKTSKSLIKAVGLGNLGQYRTNNGFNRRTGLSSISNALSGTGFYLGATDPNKCQFKKVTLSNGATVFVLSPNSSNESPTTNNVNQSDTFTVYGDPVNYSGNIILHFSDGKGNNISATGLDSGDISIPYSLATNVNSDVNFLSHATSASDNVSAPASYLGKTISGFDINKNGFSYAGATYNNSSVSDGFVTNSLVNSNANKASVRAGVTPSASSYSNHNIILNFKAKSASETINYYYYNGKSNASEGTNTISLNGAYDTQGTISAGNDSGLSAGWSLANSANSFTFGTGSSSVSVVPTSASTIINYEVVNNSAYDTKNSVVSSAVTFRGNNYLDTAAGSSEYTFNNNASGLSGMPAGYHIAGNQSIKYGASGNPKNIMIAPNSASFTVNFVTGSGASQPTVGSFKYRGYVGNSLIINNSTASKGSNVSDNHPLPYNYSISNGANSNFTYNANQNLNSANVPVIANATNETVKYIYKPTASSSSVVSTSNFSSSFDATSSVVANATNSNGANALSNGWQVSSGATITFNNGITDIYVKPQSASETVYYYLSNSAQPFSNASYTFSNDNSYSAGVGSYEATINSNNASSFGVPYGYELTSNDSNNVIKFENGRVGLQIQGVDHQPHTTSGINQYNPKKAKTIKPIYTNNSNKQYGPNNEPNQTPANKDFKNNTIYIYVNEYSPKDSNGKQAFIGGYEDRATYYGRTGNSENVDASDFTPDGFTPNSDTKNTVTIQPNGDITTPNTFVFDYTANESKQPTSNQTPKNNALVIDYKYAGGNVSDGNGKTTNIPSKDIKRVITGYTNEKVSASDSQLLPENFSINTPQSTSFTIPYETATKTVYVTPQNAPIKVTFYNHNNPVGSDTINMSELTNTNTLVGKSADITHVLRIPEGYYLPNKDVEIPLYVPFYEKAKNGVEGQMLRVNLQSSVPASTSTDTSASTSSAASQSSMASSVINSYIKSSSESSSATSALSNSAKQINSDINSAKNWDQNSSISDGTRKSISNDINTMNSDNSKANQFSGKGTNGSTSAQPYFNNASSAYSDASNLAKNAQNSIASSEQNATNAKSSAASVSASSALSNSTSQINANISSAKNWTSNSAINDTNRSSINNDISIMNADISEANQYINQGVSGSASAAPYLASASSAYSAASSLANSAINSYNNSVSASTLSSLVTNAVSNATKSNKPASASSVSLTSDEEKAIANDVNANIKPNSAVVTNTVVDHSALTSLTNEVATENQSINSLANKPEATTNVNYGNFDNLINNGIDKLEDTINKDFKANISNVHAQPVKPRKTVGKIGKRTYSYLKWLRVVKPLKLYNNKHEVVKIIKPNHRHILNVKVAYKVNNHIVFKVTYKHHNYFIKANSKAIKNAYLPATKKLIGKRVRVLYNVYANKHKTNDRVKTLHRGYSLRVRNIVKIGNHNVTRIQLSNGLWISANLNYVKVL